MLNIGEIERLTQDRVVRLFQNALGYTYLGNWEEKEENANIEEDLLTTYLSKKGHSADIISKTLYQVNKTAHDQSRHLYDINKMFYSMLRYGVPVQPEAGRQKETVWLIDWEHPQENDFAIAEEVSIQGVHTKRPDIVLYVNGIALGVIELKRSTVSISEGIRQNLENQNHIFIRPFFNTVQMVMAGSDSEGLAYGAIGTREKYFLKWKEVNEENNARDGHLLSISGPIRKLADTYESPLDQNIIQMLNKERWLEMIHDFVVYDRGQKKLCRPNQYFGVKASQDYIRRREGGIIWHTQGSGKSLTMVWLTKWIREYDPQGRVLIITDREELDEQIEKVFMGVSEDIRRTGSGKELLELLNDNRPWLMCSLVHKFGGRDEGDVDSYVQELKRSIPSDYSPKGNLYIFVDECHRTQSGKLHSSMKQFLPDALFIGFTGTPLLKTDKQTSWEVFGPYIHTYKFDEAVRDKVVLDLRYEARDVEQKITSADKIDEWFDFKTKGLTDFARTQLKQKWGTIKKVFSSKSRLEKIVMDIMLDMERKERLQNGHGNALLVSDSIYNACRYYELFRSAGLDKCAIITSYNPNVADIKGEDSGEGRTEKIQRYDIYKKMLGDYFNEDPEEALKKIETFETEVKQKFIYEPAQMKLLIVVSKLLTGFDAPSATYLYIDKKLQDHGLFQAVCRVNRLDGDDKEYGYIVDYMDLFHSLKESFEEYTSGAFADYDKEDVAGLLKDRLQKGKECLDDALEAMRALMEPVEPPKERLDYIHYFCGSNTEDQEAIKETEPRRVALYKLTISVIRAYSSIADEMDEAGYSSTEASAIQQEIREYENLRKEIQLVSGDYVDLKQYEPAMRFMIDSYLGAEDSRKLADFDDLSLVDLLLEKGGLFIQELPESLRDDHEAVAETIENNLRKVIIEERPTNPFYYEEMSTLLDEIIKNRKMKTQAYEEYLNEIVRLTAKIVKPENETSYPGSIHNGAKRSLYDNLGRREDLALAVDKRIMTTKKDGWRDHKMKMREVKLAIKNVLEEHGITAEEEVHRIFELVKSQRDY